MTYSKPMQILVDEHTVILSVLDAVEKVAGDSSKPFNGNFYAKVCDFLATFADKCHHAKEENQLFPLLESRGIPRQQGPIGVMLHEHTEGRAHIAAIRENLAKASAGEAAAQQTIRDEGMAYVDLLRQHINKENTILFVMGDRVLSDQDRVVLIERYAQAEQLAQPAGTHQKYVALAKELRQTAGLID